VLFDVESAQYIHYKVQSVKQGSTHVIGKFLGGGARTAFGAINGDEVRVGVGFNHGLANADEFAFVAYTKLKTHGFAPGEFAALLNKGDESERGVECFMEGR